MTKKRKTTVDLDPDLHMAAAKEMQPGGRFYGLTIGWLLNRGLEAMVTDSIIRLDDETSKLVAQAQSGHHRGRESDWIVREAVKHFLSSEGDGVSLSALLNLRQACLSAFLPKENVE